MKLPAHRRAWWLLLAALVPGSVPPPAGAQPPPPPARSVPAPRRAAAAAAPTFSVSFTPEVSAEPFTGRLYVMLARMEPDGGRRGETPEPRFGPDWFDPQPFFALDVRALRPGDPALVGGKGTLQFPKPPAPIAPGTYLAQAVLDRNRGERDFSNAPGNGYSAAVVRVTVGGGTAAAAGKPIPLVIDRVVPPRRFEETDRIKEVRLSSPLLSRFYGRPILMRAAVLLPEGYDAEPGRRYPVVYIVPGFGGRHYDAPWMANLYVTAPDTPMLRVVLDPEADTGHHVFADSANNGPRGRALVEELMPHIETTYRAIGTTSARFVTGHSSGGWSSLWLQVTFPDTFGGVWSTSPDPVDFRDFQRIDLYAPRANMFRDAAGRPRPLARRGTTPVVFYKAFSDMETVIGHGGQLASFEAVFSPRGPDNKPRPLWDRETGAVDPVTAKAWEKYDIRLVLERNWATLAPKLKGKLHVYTGGLDTFYLEGAVVLLKASLARLGSDAQVEVIPGKDHSTLLAREMLARIAREMAETYRKNSTSELRPATGR
jgi:S-formylglutathione hydrolase FrmB